MKPESISTLAAPKAIGPYSQAIVAAPFIFVSGQIGIHPGTGELVGGDICDQTEQALRNMDQILQAAGSDRDHVVSVDVFLCDMADFQAMNGVYESFFHTHRPARAAIGVAALPKGAIVEIRCTAVRK